jgi:hypothetical protein
MQYEKREKGFWDWFNSQDPNFKANNNVRVLKKVWDAGWAARKRAVDYSIESINKDIKAKTLP